MEFGVNRLTPANRLSLWSLSSTWRQNYVIVLGSWPIFNCLALSRWKLFKAIHLWSERKKNPLLDRAAFANVAKMTVFFFFTKVPSLSPQQRIKEAAAGKKIEFRFAPVVMKLCGRLQMSVRKNSDYIIFFSIETFFTSSFYGISFSDFTICQAFGKLSCLCTILKIFTLIVYGKILIWEGIYRGHAETKPVNEIFFCDAIWLSL